MCNESKTRNEFHYEKYPITPGLDNKNMRTVNRLFNAIFNVSPMPKAFWVEVGGMMIYDPLDIPPVASFLMR